MKIPPIPTGTKDVLPPEAAERRCLEGTIRKVFGSFGYVEVRAGLELIVINPLAVAG